MDGGDRYGFYLIPTYVGDTSSIRVAWFVIYDHNYTSKFDRGMTLGELRFIKWVIRETRPALRDELHKELENLAKYEDW